MSTLTFKDRLPRLIVILSLFGIVGWILWTLSMDYYSPHRAAKAFGEAIKAKDYNAVNSMIDYPTLERKLSWRHSSVLEEKLLAYFPKERRRPVGFGGACKDCMLALLPFAPKIAELGLSVNRMPSAYDMSKAIIKKMVSPQTVMVLLLSKDTLSSTFEELGNIFIELDYKGYDSPDARYFRTALNQYIFKRTTRTISSKVSYKEVTEKMKAKQRAKQEAFDALPEVTGMEVHFKRIDNKKAHIRLAKGPLGSDRKVDIVFSRPGMFEEWKIVDIKEAD